jgi:hypothetical protein
MTHHVFSVSAADKQAVVHELASGQQRSLLFMRTKHTAKKLAKQLTAAGIPAVELHGNLSQDARERNLSAFTDGSTRVLVATDIAARGIHVDDVALVVHVDPPTEHKAYLHRSGRTARAAPGGTGRHARDARPGRGGPHPRQAGRHPPDDRPVRPGAPDIAALTGPPAAYVTPPAAGARAAASAAGPPAGRAEAGRAEAGRPQAGRVGPLARQRRRHPVRAGPDAGRAGGAGRPGRGAAARPRPLSHEDRTSG